MKRKRSKEVELYVTFVTNIRNDEIHNDSPLDEFTDIVQYSPTRWAITKPYYVVNNQTLYEKIKKCLEALLHITNAMQKGMTAKAIPFTQPGGSKRSPRCPAYQG